MEKIDRIKKQGESLFDRGRLMTLWQEMAENFYPERADFTAITAESATRLGEIQVR